jgi:hypothetical protein
MFTKVGDDRERHELVLVFFFNVHQPPFFPSFLQQTQKALELDVVRLPHVEDLVQALDGLCSYEGDLRVALEVLDALVLVQKALQPGYKVRLLGFVAADRCPHLQGALALELGLNFMGLVLFY